MLPSFVRVPGTAGTPYLFGAGEHRRPIEIGDFLIATTPVTQALWMQVMGSNPAARPDLLCPVENVSWEQITNPGGFMDRINASEILPAVAGGNRSLRFRLPSESEWEYAARGAALDRRLWRYGIQQDAHDGCIGFRLVLAERTR